MAFSHGSSAKVLLDGFNASRYVNEVSLEGEIDSAETTVLGDTAKTYIPGLQDATASFSGFYDQDVADPTLAFSTKINALQSTITQATYLPAGDVHGYPAYILKGFLTSASIEASVDDVVSTEFELQNSTGSELGLVLHPLSEETATDDGTEIDNSASSANGMTAVLHVTEVSGTDTPTLTVVIEHSADNVTYATLGTFTANTAKGSEYLTMTGTVNQYVRAQWTISGTNPEFTFHVAAHRK